MLLKKPKGSRFSNRMVSTVLTVVLALSTFVIAPNVAAEEPAQAQLNTDLVAREQTQLNTGLVAHYTFEPDTFTTGESGVRQVLDQSGKNNNATMYWEAGTFDDVANGIEGASLNFNNGTRAASGAYLQLPSDIIKDSESYTVSGWINLTSNPSDAPSV